MRETGSRSDEYYPKLEVEAKNSKGEEANSEG